MDTAEWGPHEEEEERRAPHSRQGHRKKQPLTEEPPRSATPNRMRDFGGPDRRPNCRKFQPCKSYLKRARVIFQLIYLYIIDVGLGDAAPWQASGI